MTGLVLPLAAYLEPDDVRRIAATMRTNSQVREASGMPPDIEQLFDQICDLPGALEVWRDLSGWLATKGRNGSPSDWYAYPGLAAKVAAKTATQ